MRDPNRIDDFCSRLAVAWKTYPDFRFGQMFMNIMNIEGHPEIYYAEDSTMIAFIEKWMSNFIGGDSENVD